MADLGCRGSGGRHGVCFAIKHPGWGDAAERARGDYFRFGIGPTVAVGFTVGRFPVAGRQWGQL